MMLLIVSSEPQVQNKYVCEISHTNVLALFLYRPGIRERDPTLVLCDESILSYFLSSQFRVVYSNNIYDVTPQAHNSIYQSTSYLCRELRPQQM